MQEQADLALPTEDGPNARFNSPTGIIIDINGNIYVTDRGNHTIRKIVWIEEDQPNVVSLSSTGNAAVTAAGSAIEGAADSTEAGGWGEGEDEESFHFSLSSGRIKLGMGNMTGAFSTNQSPYSRTLQVLEKTLEATKAMKQVSENITIWASGVYSQGSMKQMFGNPASIDKHYGIIIGSHYYHRLTKQLIGAAVDIGLGNSFVHHDHKIKNTYHSGQVNLYYGLGFADNWRIGINGSFMRTKANHHRPYTINNNNYIAVSHGRSHVTSTSVELSYKYKPPDGFHLKPSFGLQHIYTKQFAYQENNAGTNSLKFDASSMYETGMKFGLKGSLFYQQNENKIYGFYPHVSYTRYIKMGTMKQRITSISSGQSQFIQSGTAGKNLLSITLGTGIIDKEKSTKIQVGYTTNFQKYRKSHELMLKYSMIF